MRIAAEPPLHGEIGETIRVARVSGVAGEITLAVTADSRVYGRVSTPEGSPATELIPGDIVDGRFQIVERLGIGGAGVVYRCVDREREGSPAALKLFHGLAEADDPEALAGARRRFLDEARILGSLEHPQLVEIVASRTHGDEPYIAMEYLAGPSLKTWLEEHGPLDWSELVEVGVQLLSALGTLHSHGIIHRDIKPSNIVLVARDPLRVKLIDLGSAKVIDWTRVNPEMTRRWRARHTLLGEIHGTPGYVAPEAGTCPADPSRDLYALAVTLYQLGTGELPEFPDREGDGPTVRGRIPGAPSTLETLLAESLARSPSVRPQTAPQMLRRLTAIRLYAGKIIPFGLGDHYECLEVLGRGAKSTVIRGYDRIAQRDLAIKIHSAEALQDPDTERRIRIEAMLLARVDNPVFPRLFRVAIIPEQGACLLLSLAPGEPAHHAGLHFEILSPLEVVVVGKKLAGALFELHIQGALHRDIHGGNILIARVAGEREPQVTLLDLGMAELTPRFYEQSRRYTTPPEYRRQLPSDREILQNLPWTAPEVREGGPWSERSDIWALALVLVRLLTGKTAFHPGATQATPIRELLPGCPPVLSDLLDRALSRVPGARPNAERLWEALDDAEAELRAELAELAKAAKAAKAVKTVKTVKTAERVEAATRADEPARATEAAEASAAPETPETTETTEATKATKATKEAKETAASQAPQPSERAPANVGSSPRPPGRRWLLPLAVAAMMMIGGGVWWGQRTAEEGSQGEPPTNDVAVTDAAGGHRERGDGGSTPPPRHRPNPDEEPAQAAEKTSDESPSPGLEAASEPETSLAAAIEPVAAELDRCAAATEERFIVHYVTQKGEQVIDATVLGSPPETLVACVDQVVARISWSPEAPPQSLLKEYIP